VIIEALILLAAGIIKLVVDLLPDAQTLPWLTGSGSIPALIISNVKAWNAHFPAVELLSVVALLVTVETVILAFRTGRWVYKHLPFIG